MRLLKFVSAVIIVSAVVVGCKGKQDKPIAGNESEQSQTKEIKEGENIFKDKDGNLQYIAEYKNGKTNGRVRQFYPDGKLYMDAIYKDGLRDGKCTYYFKNGNPFTVSNYVNGNIEGTENKYYEDGKLLSVNTYLKNNVMPGLIEYEKDGKEIPNNVSIIIKRSENPARDGKYFIHVSLSNPGISASYFVSYADGSGKREKLKMSGNDGVFEIPASSGKSVTRKLIFDALFITRKGNTRKLQKSYDLVDG